MTTLKKIGLALLLLTIGLVIGMNFKPSFEYVEKTESINSTILLEKIKEVTKLITIEGYMSEIYNYKDYYNYDISPLRKKALVRVNAKVSVGFDFNKMEVSIKPHLGKVIINRFPDAEILSIDHELDYYDVTEGFFNEFSPEDYNKINKAAKQQIIDSAQKSDLILKAESRKADYIEMISSLLYGTGLTLEVKETSNVLN